MVRLSVKVKPGSKEDSVAPDGEARYIVRVKERAIEGRANEAVVMLLSEHFGVPKSRMRVIRGAKGRNKVVEIS